MTFISSPRSNTLCKISLSRSCLVPNYDEIIQINSKQLIFYCFVILTWRRRSWARLSTSGGATASTALSSFSANNCSIGRSLLWTLDQRLTRNWVKWTRPRIVRFSLLLQISCNDNSNELLLFLVKEDLKIITNHALIQRSASAALRKYPLFAPGKNTGNRWVTSVVWPANVATIVRVSTFQHWIDRPAVTKVLSSCSIQIRKTGLLSTFHWLEILNQHFFPV